MATPTDEHDITEGIKKLIEETRGTASDADRIIARLDHQLGYLHSISVNLDSQASILAAIQQLSGRIDAVQKAVSLCFLPLLAIAIKLWFF